MDSKSSRSGVKTRSVSHSSNADNIATTSNMADHVNKLRESSDDMPDTPTMQLSKQIQELSKEIKKLHDLPERMAQLESKISHDNAVNADIHVFDAAIEALETSHLLAVVGRKHASI